MSVRPLVFGYLRTQPGVTDGLVAWMRGDLADYAEREGFALAGVFVEHADGGSSALMALIDALNRHEAQAIVVPALQHFSLDPADGHALRLLVERETGAPVLVMYPSAGDPA